MIPENDQLYMAEQLPKIAIAMSGGVDSSVAAALLAEQGFEVAGIMLRLWSEPGGEDSNRCCTPDAMAMARRVAAKLKIPFYVLDAQEVFRQIVVEHFLNGYTKGVTPNPCLVCNRHIRWEFLFNHVLAMGADALATGHYVRIQPRHNGELQLLRGIDTNKDQSYVLHMLNQHQLRRAYFPLGGYTKTQVRELARRLNLPVADRPESQDLCFLGNTDYRDFLTRYAPQSTHPGPILNTSGETLGYHNGLSSYTIGQRKKLNIPSTVPLFVIDKLIEQNALVVGTKEELGFSELTAHHVSWISDIPPIQPFRALVKIRYKSHDEWAVITPLSHEKIHVRFDRPQRDITPGQSAVLYDGDICLGGGEIIQSS